MKVWWITVSVVAFCTTSCLSANILAILPIPAKSHQILFQPLLKELANIGHNVTVIREERFVKETIANFTEIVIGSGKSFKDDKHVKNMFSTLFTPNKMSSQLLFNTLLMVGQKTCKEMLSDETVQRLLRSDQTFDLVMAEISITQESFAGLSYRYKAPLIGLTTFPGKETLEEFTGNPNPAAYLPNWLTDFNDRMSFFERAWNVYLLVKQLYTVYFYHLPIQEQIMNEYIPSVDRMPPILDLLANVSIVLHNSHIGVTYARPYNPNIIEVAGMHIPTQRKPLPRDLQEFMDNATEGVVYFSLGSNIKPHLMSVEMKHVFVQVFSKLKQKILWKIDIETLPGLPNNVKLVKWLPQDEILAHKNCKAFISHGGMLSVEEAIHFGVPLLGFPFFGDQPMNLAFVQAKGVGIKMNFNDITYESLSSALNEILNNPIYYNNMKKQSAIFNDRPEPPLEKAIYWIEYVLRHRGAPHLQSAAARMSWFKYFLLDVIIVLFLGVIIILSILVWLVASLYRRLFTKKEHKD